MNDNVIQFYIELNDNMSAKLKGLKGDFEDAFDGIAAVAEKMVASIENAFTNLDFSGAKESFSKTIKSLRDNARSRKPIKIPIEFSVAKAAAGSAAGALLGSLLGGTASVKAPVKVSIGAFGAITGPLQELRKKIKDWFQGDRQTIPLRFSTAITAQTFGGKGGMETIRTNLKNRLGIDLMITGIDIPSGKRSEIKDNFLRKLGTIRPLISKNPAFEDGVDSYRQAFTDAIHASIGPALTDASQAAADVFVQTIMAGLSMAAHAPPAQKAMEMFHAGIQFPPGQAGERWSGKIQQGKFREAVQGWMGAAGDPEAQKIAFLSALTGEKPSKFKGAEWFKQTKIDLTQLGGVGEVSEIKQMERTPGAQQGIFSNLFGSIARGTLIPPLAEGGEIPESVDEVLVRLHGGEAVLPYAKAEKSISDIIRNSLERGGEFAPGGLSGIFSGGTVRVELVVSPDFTRTIDAAKDIFSKGTPEQVKAFNEAAQAYLAVMSQYEPLLKQQAELKEQLAGFGVGGATGTPYVGLEVALNQVTDAIDAMKGSVKDVTQAYEATHDAAFKYRMALEREINAVLAGSGGAGGYRNIPTGINLGGPKFSPEAQNVALGAISIRSLAQTGETSGGDVAFREMAAAIEAAKVAGGSWVEIQGLITASAGGAEQGYSSVGKAMAAYESIMSKANVETVAGARAFATARQALINLTKRLEDNQKSVEGTAGEYSSVNLQLNELIDRAKGSVNAMDKLKRAEEGNTASAARMTLSFRGLLSEAKKLAPVLMTFAGAKVSARIDTALMSTREQLVNNEAEWSQYRDIALDVMGKTGLSIDEVGKIMTTAARRGFESRHDIEEFTNTVAMVAVSAKGMSADVESATSMAAYNFKRLGIQVSDYDSAFSQLIMSSREGALTLSDLNTVIGGNIEWLQKTGETSEQATRRMSRFAGAAQVLSESFGTAAQGATAVNELMTVVTALADPAQYGGPIAAEMTTLLQYAGVSFEELMAKVQRRDFASVIQDLAFAMQQVPTEQVNQFGTAIEGLIGVSRETLMQFKMDPTITRRLEQTLAAIDMAGMSTDEMVEAMARYNLSLEQSINVLKGQFAQAADGAFGTVKDALNFIVQKVALLLNWFNNLPAGIQSAVGIFAAVASLTLLVGTMGKILVALGLAAKASQAIALASMPMKEAGVLMLGASKNFMIGMKGLAKAGLITFGLTAGISAITDLVRGDYGAKSSKKFWGTFGLEGITEIWGKHVDMNERYRRRLETLDAQRAKREMQSTEAQSSAATAMDRLVDQLAEKKDRASTFQLAVARQIEQMNSRWQEAVSQNRQYTVIDAATGQRRTVSASDVDWGIAGTLDQITQQLRTVFGDQMTRDQALAELIEGATIAARYEIEDVPRFLGQIPENITDPQVAEAFATTFVRRFMESIQANPEFFPLERGYIRTQEEQENALARALRSGNEQSANLSQWLQTYGNLTEELVGATARRHPGQSSYGMPYDVETLAIIRALRSVYGEAAGPTDPLNFSGRDEHQLELTIAQIRGLGFATAEYQDILRSLNSQLAEASLSEASRLAEAGHLEHAGSLWRQAERFMQQARQAEYLRELFRQPVEESTNARVRELFRQYAMEGEEGVRETAEFRMAAMRRAYEQYAQEQLEGRPEEQAHGEKVVRSILDTDRRFDGKYESPQAVVAGQGTSGAGGKPEKMVVVSDSPKVVKVLEDILSVLQDERDRKKSEITTKGNPFLRKTILGIG